MYDFNQPVKVFAPATVANVGPGFDIFGLALNDIGDTIEIQRTKSPGIQIEEISGCEGLSKDPEKNVAGIALSALLKELEVADGMRLKINKTVMAGSGLGSSASSSAAAVFGANELLGRPYTKAELVPFAMEGERGSSGIAHADNVAPSLLGGFTFVRSYDPLEVIRIDTPEGLHVSVLHPQIEIKTADAKKILKREVTMKDAIRQWGNIAGLITGLLQKDFGLIGRSMEDHIVEPVRSLLIPGYDQLKAAALQAGALGCSISGSGPSVFALTKNQQDAEKVVKSMGHCYEKLNIHFKTYISAINPQGAELINA
ncbi:MAG: homoserine kinase [Fulvivirga sp.]|nr:homoserine kinase [Fulvivirga sp.]